VLTDAQQNICAEASAPLEVSRPHPLWSEQNPAHWWDAAQKAVKALDGKLRSGVKAIGLSGQMHGAVCLGENDEVLRPAILWNDGRSGEQCAQMMDEMPALIQIAGNLAMPGFTAPKLQWMRVHERDIFAKIRKVLLPKDYLRLLMSGDYASDMSDSAGTLWMDVAARDWSDDILALTGLSRSHMPALFEGSAATGVLRADIAADWGLPARVPICGGGGDNAAGAVGSGTIAPGEGFVSLGTSGVIFTADTAYRPNPASAVHTFCHALPHMWHQMSVMLSAASAVDFAARITGFENPAKLYAAAAAHDTPSQGAIFLPYLSGERTPHNNPKASGAFYGLTHEDSPVTLAQAALEGVAFGLADGLDALRSAGAAPKALSVIGGGARSLYWGKILASCFNLPLNYRGGAAVGPAYGAARLARLCVSGERPEDVCTPPEIEDVVLPDPALSAHFAERRSLFQSIYTNTKELGR
jgi:xylulokinase